jgi:hypothetical protein
MQGDWHHPISEGKSTDSGFGAAITPEAEKRARKTKRTCRSYYDPGTSPSDRVIRPDAANYLPTLWKEIRWFFVASLIVANEDLHV